MVRAWMGFVLSQVPEVGTQGAQRWLNCQHPQDLSHLPKPGAPTVVVSFLHPETRAGRRYQFVMEPSGRK